MKFNLRCLKCGKKYPEDIYICKCEQGCDSVLRTEYQQKEFEINDTFNGIWKYSNWLPIQHIDDRLRNKSSSFVTYKSTHLAQHLGLHNLVICLNIYPNMSTGSFKDIEAQVSFQRVIDSTSNGKPLVISSDGNNAISFIHYSNIIGYPIVLFVTEDARTRRIWSLTNQNPHTHLISIQGDYYDAIHMAGTFGKIDGFLSEGGAMNVARRDGVGTILLDATRFLGRIPDHYFQALGSGPGAIATYEAALRLIQDGRFGSKAPKIHGSQNYPYIPMYDAWTEKSRTIHKKYQTESAKALIDQTYAHVLTNRHPAYSIKGGVYDVLSATDGEFYSITNEEAQKAQRMFKTHEGWDIVPEAGVTVASLLKAVHNETIHPTDSILLNITGGGREKIQEERFKIGATIPPAKDYNLDQIAQGIIT